MPVLAHLEKAPSQINRGGPTDLLRQNLPDGIAGLDGYVQGYERERLQSLFQTLVEPTARLFLPPGMAARYTGGSLRPVPQPPRPGKARGDLRDRNAAASDSYDFDAYEELEPDVEAVVTTFETPLLDTKRIDTGSTVTGKELEKVPTARDPWAELRNAPGVMTDRINVGGNEGSQQSFSLNRAGTAVEVRPSLQAAPGSREMRLSGALPPRQVTAEIEVKEAKRR